MQNNDTETLEFEIVPDGLGLELAAKNSLELAFSGFFAEAAKWKENAADITEPKLARVARLELKALRIAAEKKRKELKEDSLRMGRAIDGANNILLALISPIERSLEDVEKQEERRIAAEQAATLEARRERFEPFRDASTPTPSLGAMTDEQFENFLKDAELLFNTKREAAEKAERERIEREKKEAAEREAQRLENIRLKKEAEEREKQIQSERDAAEKLRKKQEEEAAKARKEAEAKARKEAEEWEKLETEARKLREAEQERIRKEKEAKAAAEKAAKDREKAEKEAARKAAAAPDKKKLHDFAQEIREMKVPAMASDEGKAVADEVAEKVAKFAAWIEAQAKKV